VTERHHDPYPGPRLLAKSSGDLLLHRPKEVLTPNDFASLEELASIMLAFTDRYNQTARPFNWKFTAADLTRLLDRISAHEHAAEEPAELPEVT
jgi:hypothetical protein